MILRKSPIQLPLVGHAACLPPYIEGLKIYGILRSDKCIKCKEQEAYNLWRDTKRLSDVVR